MLLRVSCRGQVECSRERHVQRIDYEYFMKVRNPGTALLLVNAEGDRQYGCVVFGVAQSLQVGLGRKRKNSNTRTGD